MMRRVIPVLAFCCLGAVEASRPRNSPRSAPSIGTIEHGGLFRKFAGKFGLNAGAAPVAKPEEHTRPAAPAARAPKVVVAPVEAEPGNRPLHRCNSSTSKIGGVRGLMLPEAQQNLNSALAKLCQSEFANLADIWLAPGYESNYKQFYGADGWTDEAFVNYFADNGGERGAKFLKETELLIESVHRFSTRPIVAVNFGTHSAPDDWAHFPRLVVFNARPLPAGKSFNYNKFRAMLLVQVRTAIQLDSDQFVARAADRIFTRTAEEVTRDYPYPILPVHWLSKDDDARFPNHAYKDYDYHCAGCANRTMRWGHAHPTWTHWALPFIGNLLESYLDHGKLGEVPADRIAEDEDALNVGLWAVGATKQWCKFDIPSPALFEPFLKQQVSELKGNDYSDPKWFPKGIPLLFYTAHDCKDPAKTTQFINELAAGEPPGDIYYNGHFYSSPAELKAADPGLRCIA